MRKQDILTAKNYLKEDEIDQLNRLTVIFLETAELRVQDRKDLTIDYWRKNVDRLLEFNDKNILKNAGSVSRKQMESRVNEVYKHFDQRRKEFDAKQADLEDLKYLEDAIKRRNE